jgi:hypothetical protein
VADLDQSDPQAVSKLGHGAWQTLSAPSDRGAGPPLIDKIRDVVADVGGELPGAAIHGGLLHCLGLRTDRGLACEGHQLLWTCNRILRLESTQRFLDIDLSALDGFQNGESIGLFRRRPNRFGSGTGCGDVGLIA